MQIEEWLATAVCERFEDDGVVAPTILRKGLFTVGALDNLDHDPSATTATTSFHGTGISIFQFPSRRNPVSSGNLSHYRHQGRILTRFQTIMLLFLQFR